MADFTAPTRDQPISKDKGYTLWKYRSFPVERIVWIDGDDNVTETESPMDKHLSQDAADGTGENGKSVFRYGKTYTVNATEEAALIAAGYTLT